MIRSTIQVERPAFYRADSSGYAESWLVTVDQIKRVGAYGWHFEVIGTLLCEHIPRQYDTTTAQWIEAHDRTIPGLTVPAAGPEVLNSLAAARERARRLADVLDGRLRPQWKETQT